MSAVKASLPPSSASAASSARRSSGVAVAIFSRMSGTTSSPTLAIAARGRAPHVVVARCRGAGRSRGSAFFAPTRASASSAWRWRAGRRSRARPPSPRRRPAPAAELPEHDRRGDLLLDGLALEQMATILTTSDMGRPDCAGPSPARQAQRSCPREPGILRSRLDKRLEVRPWKDTRSRAATPRAPPRRPRRLPGRPRARLQAARQPRRGPFAGRHARHGPGAVLTGEPVIVSFRLPARPLLVRRRGHGRRGSSMAGGPATPDGASASSFRRSTATASGSSPSRCAVRRRRCRGARLASTTPRACTCAALS